MIYQAITALALRQQPVDILTIAEQLRSTGDLDEVGGPFYITQLSGKVASSAHIEYHARIIAQKFLARELISFTSNIQTKAFDETQDVDDLMQEAEGKLFEISQQNMKKDYTQINPVIQEAYEMLPEGVGSDGWFKWFGEWFPCTGQDDFRLAEFGPYYYCRSSRHG